MLRKALVVFLFGFFAAAAVFSQAAPDKDASAASLQNGIRLYRAGNFAAAASELRRIGANQGDYAEALYWTGLAELAAGKYRESLAAFETLERHDPSGKRLGEVPYHKGRLYFYLGRYDEALTGLSAYAAAQPDRIRKAQALYWAGESLYAMGQLDKAGDTFALIVEKYPDSAKYEAALYRLEMVKQKKIEAELLAIIKWTNEENLKNAEEARRREKAYAQAIAVYQKRFGKLPAGGGAEAETSGEGFDGEPVSEIPAVSLDAGRYGDSVSPAEAGEEALPKTAPPETRPDLADKDEKIRLLSIKTEILGLRNIINEKLRDGEK